MKKVIPGLFLMLSASFAWAQTTGSNVFHASVNNWVVPPGVTTLTVEAWGGGGGGSPFYGGAGGGYFKAVLPIPAGTLNSINVTVGNGGAGCTAGGASGAGGGSTTVTYRGTTMTAGGASGSTLGSGSMGGSYSMTAGAKFYFRGETGQSGTASRILATSNLTAATSPTSQPAFYASAVGGDGGESGNSTNTHGGGGSEFVWVTPPANAPGSYRFSPVVFRGLPSGWSGANGTVPGGGGGGAPSVSFNVACGSGANGLVIVSW